MINCLSSGFCVGCKETISFVQHKKQASVWNYKDCTRVEKSNANGKIVFDNKNKANVYEQKKTLFFIFLSVVIYSIYVSIAMLVVNPLLNICIMNLK